jgi:hypothetical protein
VISYSMWPAALVAIAVQWRTLGRVVLPALLAFSSFMVIFAQNYGGEAIYRIFLFSAPWCALLIAGMLVKLGPALWRLAASCVCITTLAAGLAGSYLQASAETFTPSELTASLWLYDHAPNGSLFVLPVDNFPDLESADFNDYNVIAIPANIDEDNIGEVQEWISSLGYHTIYVVFSRSMAEDVNWAGRPSGYAQMVNAVWSRPGWSIVYRNTDATIYSVSLTIAARQR